MRNNYLDLLKGVLIFLVVFGHVLQYIGYDGTESFYSDLLWEAIYFFHIPLFIGISGYLAYNSINKQSVVSFNTTRIVHFLVPMLAWSCIIGMIVFDPNLPILKSFKRTVLYPIYLYWFLWALLFNSFIASVLSFVKKDNLVSFIIISILLLFVDIPLIPIFNMIKSTFLFFCVGYLLARIDVVSYYTRYKKHSWILLVSAVILYFNWDVNTSMYITPYSYLSIKEVLVRLLSGFVFSMLFMQIMYFIYNRIKTTKIVPMFVVLGKNTIGIYLMQTVFFFCWTAKELSLPSIPMFYITLFLIACVLTAVCACVSLLLDKNKLSAFIFLGKKLKK